MKRLHRAAQALALLFGGLAAACSVMAPAAAPDDAAGAVRTLDQGGDWTRSDRVGFYSRDQGSRIMPLAWMRSLRAPDGTPFLADGLRRFGYIANGDVPSSPLPVGFVVGKQEGEDAIGMTCAACHTRQIVANGQAWRVDGGPALADFQRFLTELDAAVGEVLASDAAFKAFALSVLGPAAGDADAAALRTRVADWYRPYHLLVSRARCPRRAWGVGRLDAVSMIFNRLTGLDLGPPPDFTIARNIYPANAPVRYPFLWNAPRQDKTQWPGFADNGDELLALARNLGEVIGVFAVFHPMKDEHRIFGINYIKDDSADFAGLKDLESTIARIGPPGWPWPVDAALAARGGAVFAANCASGCHEVARGAQRLSLVETWKTPVMNVGTDTREWSILDRRVDPGVLTGIGVGSLRAPLAASELPSNVLGTAVIGAILDHAVHVDVFGLPTTIEDPLAFTLPEKLQGTFGHPPDAASPPPGSYESRVLQGIWAAAPYLHDGSVPTLAELLKAPADRVAAFAVGPNYDTVGVGLAVQQPAGATTMRTTGCEALDSGNSRCGHAFGWDLPAADKAALVEYMKTL